MKMAQGTIKKLVSDRGFGFIAGENGEVFFPLASLRDCQFEDLTTGQAVEYELDLSDRGKGPCAARVTIA